MPQVERRCQSLDHPTELGPWMPPVERPCQSWDHPTELGPWMPPVERPCQSWDHPTELGSWMPQVERPCQSWDHPTELGSWMPQVERPCQSWDHPTELEIRVGVRSLVVPVFLKENNVLICSQLSRRPAVIAGFGAPQRDGLEERPAKRAPRHGESGTRLRLLAKPPQ
ncbi:hypothetical protein RRG08_016914 [Elysia crispata]|uniref:Uncharacterized protein n=1 Tax=Elysia crispata TaxID=231223 RepID=A0AAE1DIX7_9GAST|nr:hypothetical protein RRG08_016914 [Elysia crispata]